MCLAFRGSVGHIPLLHPTLSSSGLGHRPFTAVTRVRIPLGSPSFDGECAAHSNAVRAERSETGEANPVRVEPRSTRCPRHRRMA
jgi:hypothetical protein